MNKNAALPLPPKPELRLLPATAPAEARVYGLDLLRACAIVSVLGYHYPKAPEQLWLRALTHYGWAGVDLFFVLSGFLIAGQLFARLREQPRASLRSFYLRRLVRTLPAYFTVLALYAAWEGLPGTWWPYLLFVQNFGLPSMFTQSWSLCVEEQFYAVFPLLLATGRALREHSLRSRRGIALATGLVLLAGVALRALVWSRARPDLAASVDDAFQIYLRELFYPTWVRLDGLTVGVALAALKVFHPELWRSWQRWPGRFGAFGAATLALAALGLHSRFSLPANALGFPLLALGFGALLVCSVGEGSPLTRVRIPGVPSVALLAYSLYLTHALAWGVVEKALAGTAALPLAAARIAGALAAAWLLYALVEKPCLRWRDRLRW